MNRCLFLVCMSLILNMQAMMRSIKDQVTMSKPNTGWLDDGRPHIAVMDIFVPEDNLYDVYVSGAKEFMKEAVDSNEPVAKLLRFYSQKSKIDKDDQVRVLVFGLPLRLINSWQQGSQNYGNAVFVCDQKAIAGETMSFEEKLASLKKSKELS